jgi:prevent-host-death family protein
MTRIVCMKTVAVADLKARLSEYLKHIKAGEEVVITERGLPVARLVPLAREARRATRRDRLAKAGLLRLGRGKVRKALLTPPKGRATRSVVEALLEERREGR